MVVLHRFYSIAIIIQEEKAGYFLVCLCVLVSVSHGAMGWSVIVPFPGHTHSFFSVH